MARIIAIANQKGGVGKTTTAVNLSACLATAQQPTLLVDCDSQANSTAAIGFAKDPSRRTLYHSLISNEPFDRIVQKSQVDGLDVIPADKNLAESEIEIAANVLAGKVADYVVGIGRPQGTLLILLDLGPIVGRAEPGSEDAT